MMAAAAVFTLSLVSCSTSGEEGRPDPSGTPTVAHSQPATHRSRATALTGGTAELTGRGVARTDPIRPDPRQTVVIFVLTATQGDTPAPAVSVEGGGTRWNPIAETEKIADAPRGLAGFWATGVKPGPLTIRYPDSVDQSTMWTVAQAPGSILGSASNPGGELETTHSVSLPAPPSGIVIAAFGVGQDDVKVDPPFKELVRSEPSRIGATCVLAWAWGQGTASVSFTPPGHSIATAIVLG